jgi:Domain of unknown function (DUF4124)
MTVYRSVGPDGVVAFSDAPNAAAVPIEVVPPPIPLRDDVERANRSFEQQLALLELLETSRQARANEALEQQRIDLDFVRTEAAMQRARDREAQQDEQYFPLFIGPSWGWGGWGPRPRPPWPGRPPMDRPHPPKPPPSRQVQFPH